MTRTFHGALAAAFLGATVTFAGGAFAQSYPNRPQWTDHGFSTVGSPRANNGTPATTSAFVGGGAGVGNPSSVVTSPTALSYTRDLNGPVRYVSPNAVANADESANGYSVVTGMHVRGVVEVQEPFPE